MNTEQVPINQAGKELDRLGIEYKTIERPNSLNELQSIVKSATKTHAHIFPVGGATSLGLTNLPEKIDILLDMNALDEIVHFDDKNLNMTVQAGLSIDAISAFLSAQGRGYMLPLDPMYSNRVTIGGVYAANTSGPLRHFYGTIRDQALGAGAVDTQARKVKFGGVTVKNVSGYDLTKFFIGSYGSLCIIHQISLRILPFPQAFSACEVYLDHEEQAKALLSELRQSVLIPSAVVLFKDKLDNAPRVVIGFEGHPKAIERQNQDVALMSKKQGGKCEVHTGRDNMMQSLKRGFNPVADQDPPAILKLTVPIGQGPDTFAELANITQRHNFEAKVTLLAGNGVLHIHLHSADGAEEISSYANQLKHIIGLKQGYLMFIKAPLAVLKNLERQRDEKVRNYLLQPIKSTLDPKGLLPPLML